MLEARPLRQPVLCAVALTLVGCPNGPLRETEGSIGEDTPGHEEPTPDSPVTATAVFAAYGGIGVLSATERHEDHYRVVVVVDVDSPHPAEGVVIEELVMLDAAGSTVASMREIRSIVRLEVRPASDAWAEYLDARGEPFRGTAPAGTVRLRIDANLVARPTSTAARFRLRLTGWQEPVVVEGDVAGEWPT